MTTNAIFNYLIGNLKITCIELSRIALLESYNFLGFYTYITIEISDQSYILKIVPMSKRQFFCDMEGVVS